MLLLFLFIHNFEIPKSHVIKSLNLFQSFFFSSVWLNVNLIWNFFPSLFCLTLHLLLFTPNLIKKRTNSLNLAKQTSQSKNKLSKAPIPLFFREILITNSSFKSIYSFDDNYWEQSTLTPQFFAPKKLKIQDLKKFGEIRKGTGKNVTHYLFWISQGDFFIMNFF